MRNLYPTLIALLVTACAAAPETKEQLAASSCRLATDPQTGTHIVRRDACAPAVSEEETNRRLQELELERDRMSVQKRTGASR